jgi:hypothetical protein
MRYQDGFDGQRPPWDDADYSGYGRYSGPQGTAPRTPAQAPAQSWAGEFRGGEPQPRHDEYRAHQGDYETSTDGIPAFGYAASPVLDGRQYGITGDPGYQPEEETVPGGYRRGRRRRSRGLIVGAVTGFLAAGTALGVANLAAAFVRPQASPIIAVGGAFIDRTPPALKEFAVQKFGENDKNMLLLGMYVTIALLAMAIGTIAWRHLWVGIAGIGLFGLFGAFVAYTRPESHVTDVIPALLGGVAGIVIIIWLTQWTTRWEPDAPMMPSLAQRGAGRTGWAA